MAKRFLIGEDSGVEYAVPLEHEIESIDLPPNLLQSETTVEDFTIYNGYQLLVHGEYGIEHEIDLVGELIVDGGGGGGASSHDDLSDVGADDHHDESHTIASHSDTTATGSELEELTDGSETVLHSHASVFGGGYTFAASEAESTTTSTAFQQKLKMTTGTLVDTAKYLIQWNYIWSLTDAAQDFKGRVQIDDTTTIMNQQQEAKDAGGDQYYPASGFYEHTASGTSAIEIDIDYCTSNAADTAKIREARLTFWRVE